jgi:predicted transcriptional regulator
MTEDILDRLIETREDELVAAEEAAMVDVEYLLHTVLQRKGVSQKELAERLGVSQSRVSQMLSGDSNPTVRTLARIAHVLEQHVCIEMVPSIRLHKLRDFRWKGTLTQPQWHGPAGAPANANANSEAPTAEVVG